MGGRKPSIVRTVRLFHLKIKIVKELKEELEYEIRSGLEPEVVSVTHNELKKGSQVDEVVDQLTQSENVDAADSINDAACLTKLKVEVAQTVKKHELSFRNTSTRPSSAASSRSNRIPVPSAPESPRVVQSMCYTRQQQQINDLADQQSTSNPIAIHRQVQAHCTCLWIVIGLDVDCWSAKSLICCCCHLIELPVLLYTKVSSHQQCNKQTLKT